MNRSREVKRLIELINRRFGYYTSPKTGRTLTAALRREFSDMDSLFAQAYDAIVEQEKQVDATVAELTAQNQTLAETNGQLSAALEAAGAAPDAPATPPTPAGDHDGGYIFTARGRKVGTPDDRDRLDKAIDRLTPDAPADPDFRPPAG